MNSTVDNYLINGCERCPLGGTADCKVQLWVQELKLLRRIILDCGLTEECKWGVPCYTFQHKNVLLVSAFKQYCSINFLKGSLLKDEKKILEKPGENTQVARLIKFTTTEKIRTLEPEIKTYIYEAIEVEKARLKVNYEQNPEPIPDELKVYLKEDPILKTAFDALSPGRQRGYIIYFSAPKQSKTRHSRIQKTIGKILNGEGLHDTYKRKK